MNRSAHDQFIRAVAFLHAALNNIAETVEACVIFEDLQGHTQHIYVEDINPVPGSLYVILVGRDHKETLVKTGSCLDIHLRLFPDFHEVDTEVIESVQQKPQV